MPQERNTKWYVITDEGEDYINNRMAENRVSTSGDFVLVQLLKGGDYPTSLTTLTNDLNTTRKTASNTMRGLLRKGYVQTASQGSY